MDKFCKISFGDLKFAGSLQVAGGRRAFRSDSVTDSFHYTYGGTPVVVRELAPRVFPGRFFHGLSSSICVDILIEI